MTEKELIEVLLSPNGPESAKKEGAGAEDVLALLAHTEETRVQAAALSFLVREGRTKAGREVIEGRLSDEALSGMIRSEDAKVRKNAARLTGAVRRESLDRALAEALLTEPVRMARPSQILALGALKTEAARTALQQYEVQPAADGSEEKHAAEETEALRKARASFIEARAHVFTGLKPTVYPKVRCRLVCGKGFEEALAEEIRARKAADKILGIAPGSVTVEDTDWKRLQTVRSCREVLIPLSRELLDAEKEAAALAEALVRAMAAMHEGEPPYRFRLEMGKTGAGALASRIEAASDGQLINAPGNYECELRLGLAKAGGAHAWLKLFTVEDRRFAYRKMSIPASIHPAAAAGLMWLTRPYLKKDAVVTDPCCGSGTLLYERARIPGERPAKLIGVDISAKALEAARANGSKDLPRCLWIHKDLMKLEVREQADELFANLPFGNRVGNHESNVKLYHELIRRLPEFVKPGGIAVFYTMEGKLLEKELKEVKTLRVLKRCTVEAGGLEPVAVILRVG